MAKTSLGSRVLSVLLAASMVASLNAPVSAWAAGDDATGAAAAVEQSLDPAGGGESENADAGTAGSDTSQAVENQSATDASDEEGSTEGPGEAEAGTVKIGDTAYSTLAEAIKAANDGDTITLGAGEFTTYGNASPKKSLTFVGAGEDTVWTIGDLTKDVNGEANGDYSFDGCDTITFKSMTLKSDNKNYRGFIRINNTVVENCTLVGKTAYWGYNTATFKGSTFNAPEGDYALWDYSTKEMSFDGCTFNISGKGVNVYVEAGNAGEATRTVAVNNCTVNSTKANKAFLNIKNETQAYEVTLSGTNTVTGLAADSTTGSNLYQVETTEVTETSGKTVSVKEKAADDTVTTLYEVKQASSSVAKVGDTEYATLQEAIDAAKRNETVKLLADTNENVTISTPYVTLDLNGHTLNGGQVKAKPALTVTARVTVKDSSEAQTGTIKREDTAENSGVSSHYVIDIQGAGWLTFESGNVTNNSGTTSGKGASLVRVGDDSVGKFPGLNIKGGTFTQDNFIVIKVDRGDLFLNGGTLNSASSYAIEDWHRATIKGGTVNGAAAAWTYSGGSNSDLSISGGTVNGNVISVNYGSAEDKVAKVSITGGAVNGTLGTYTYNNGLTATTDAAKATIAVTGGTFSEDPTKYVVEGSGVTANADGTFGVAKAYLAKVGDTSYYTMDEAFKAQTASGEAITLLRDYTTGSTFNSGTVARVVDLNGHTWTCTGTDANSAAFEINNSNASLTVKNGKIVSSQLVGLIPSAMGGTIKYDNSTLTFEGVEASTTATSGIETNGNNTNDTVVLKNSTLNVPNGFGIYFPSSGTLTIDNSTINAKTMGVQVCSGNLNISGADAAITVTGDGVEKTENDGAIQDGAAISIVDRTGYKGLSEIKVEGGTFTAKSGNAAVKAYKWENMAESGFTQGDKVAISGGTFSAAVASDLCAEGYAPVANADGTYSVGVPVAQIGSTVFTSLQAAIDAAQAGDTVQLLADAVVDDTVIVENKGAITLDLNGKTISNTKEIWNEGAYKWSLISVRGNSDLTITGNGALNALANDVYVIDLYDAASKCTIENGTFTGNISAVYIFEGMLTINGGSFDIKQMSSQGDRRFTINCYDSSYATGKAQVSINGGTFNGFDPANNLAEGTGTTFTAPGYTTVANADGTYGVVAGVAQIGTKAYVTLADAVAAAQDGETVTLLADAAEDVVISKSITLDLGGKTLTNTNAGKATISVQGDTVTVKNGNVLGGTGYYNIEVTKDSNANLTLTDVTATAGNTGSSMIDNWGTLTITSGTYTGGLDVVKSEEGSKLTITGGTFTLNYATDGYTAVILVYGDTTISGGEFIQSLTTTGRWDHPQVVATGVVEGYTAITRVTGGHFVNKKSGEGIFRGVGKATSDNFEVSGGTFNKSIPEGYCADGFIPTKNADGTYGVKEGSYVAKVGSTKYETLADAIRLAAKGKTIQLLNDTTENVTINASKDITLDLNGHTLNGGTGTAKATILNMGNVTITDTSAGKTGTIKRDDQGTSGETSYYVIDNNGTMVIDQANVMNNSGAKGSSLIRNGGVDTVSSLTINGGTFEQQNFIAVKNDTNGELTINGGTLTSKQSVVQNWNKAQILGGNLTGGYLWTDSWTEAGTVGETVIGGNAQFTGTIYMDVTGPNPSTLKVEGGKLDVTKWTVTEAAAKVNASIAVSGGTFTAAVPEDYCAAGYIPTQNEDGTYGVKEGSYVAEVGSKKYETLADAIAAVEDGQTVKLLADVTLNEQIAVGKAITIDGQSKYTIKAAKKLVGANNKAGMFYRTTSAQGTLTFLNVTLDGNNVSKIFLNEGGAGETVFDGVTSINGGGIAYGSGIHISGGGSHATIRNSTLTGSTGTMELNETNYYAANDLWVGGNVYVTVENSTIGYVFVNSAPSATATNGVVHGQLTITGENTKITYLSGEEEDAAVVDKFGNNGSLVKIDSGYVETIFDKGSYEISGGTFKTEVKEEWCAEGYIPTTNSDGTYSAKEGSYVAEVGSKKYETLAEAINAASAGGTVTLLGDVEQNTQLTIGKSITLDLNGKTIKISGYTAEKAQVSVKGDLTIQDSSEAQTGKICSDYTGTAGRVVSVENGGKLTIEGGTITTEGMSNSGSAVYIASGAEVNMTGGTVKVDAKRGNVAMNVKGSTGVFIMSGGSVIAEAGDGTETNITAISGSSGSTIQISVGAVSGPQAVLARSSATTITGGNFTGSITVKNGSISGGTFDRALEKKACAAGYVPTKNEDGTYGVEIGHFTVKVTSRTTTSDSPVANVSGGGSNVTYAEGTTVTASAISGYNFVGWFVNEYAGTPYSTDLTCTVKPTSDCTMIAVYEPISGGVFWLTVTASEFTVNGGAVQDSYLYEQYAIGASVTVNFTGTENFLYWVNASNKVVSINKSYTFTMGSETTLKAVYGKARQNQATVVFISHSDQIISSKAYTTSDTIQFPVPPIKMGCTFTGWSMTEAEIHAAMADNNGIIQVRALYTEPSIDCAVTVVYPDGTDNEVVNTKVGQLVNVTAKDIEGKTFSCWTDNDGNVLGYTKTLRLAPSGDMIVKAVYDEATEAKPVISMTAVDASVGDGYYVISFTATRAVPEGYELVKQGILYSADSRCAGEAGKDYLKLTADGTVPEGVYEFIGNSNELNGVTRLNGKVQTADTALYGRGYMILKNNAGDVLYVYADKILSGSYSSLTK